jgi:putative component of membrane protein insertase Oxa1/YidC/SpoIIIJ protein YidD
MSVRRELEIILVGGLLIAGAAAKTFGASLIDAQFRLQKGIHAVSKQSPSNDLGPLYKRLFTQSIYSRCQWLPSDSQYLNFSSAKCGPLRGTFLTVGRFMSESNVSDLSSQAVNDHGRIRFIDFGRSCDLY